MDIIITLHWYLVSGCDQFTISSMYIDEKGVACVMIGNSLLVACVQDFV